MYYYTIITDIMRWKFKKGSEKCETSSSKTDHSIISVKWKGKSINLYGKEIKSGH